MAKAYENGTGESCALNSTEILVKFPQSGQTHFSEVGIQRDHPVYPGNVRQIEAVFFNANDSIITDEITGEPIRWTSPEDEPTITGYFRDVRGLKLKILKTDNNEAVRRLRVKITGCHSLGLKILF